MKMTKISGFFVTENYKNISTDKNEEKRMFYDFLWLKISDGPLEDFKRQFHGLFETESIERRDYKNFSNEKTNISRFLWLPQWHCSYTGR